MKNELVNLERKEITNFDITTQKECFLNYLDVAQKSKKTYGLNIRPFMEYLTKKHIQMPTRNDVIEYRDELKKTKKPTTVNSYMIVVRQFFEWLEYMRIYPNVAKDVKGSKLPTIHRKKALSKYQAKEIIESAENTRDKCLLKLLLTTGLRCNEVVNANIEDIKEIDGRHVLMILGKGHVEKDDFVVLDNSVFNDLMAYIGERTKGSIFISLRHKKAFIGLKNRQISGIVKYYLKKIGLDSEFYSCHSTRHTFINLAFELGNDLYVVSKEARHCNTRTTEIYLEEYNKLNSNIGTQIGNLLD